MNMKLLRVVGFSLFFVGVIFGFVLAVLFTWNKIEAINYYFTGATYPAFNGLHCPTIITRSEQGTVTAIFDNPAGEENNFYYRVEFSGVVEPRKYTDHIVVPAHGRESLQWVVDEKDIDLEFFIFVKMVILPNAFHPTSEATCGITVMNIPWFTGRQIYIFTLVISLLGIGVGLSILQRVNSGMEPNRPYTLVLGTVVLLAMFSSFMGWWLMGAALLAITILLLVVFVRDVLA